MTHNSDELAFYVVQFLDLPYEGIDDYVCVPRTWVIVREQQDGKAVVAYPNDEVPSLTRDRVKRKEKYDDEWKYHMTVVKYKSNSYQNAECWIASRNNHRPLVERIADNLVERITRIPDTQPESTPNPNSRNSTQGHSSKLNDNPRKPLPRILIKRPALPELYKQLKKMKRNLEITAQNSSNLMNQPGSSSARSVEEQSSVVAQTRSQDGPRVREMHPGNSIDQTALLWKISITCPEIQQTPKINAESASNTPLASHNISSILTNLLKSMRSKLRSEQQARLSSQSTKHNNKELPSSPKNVVVSTTSDKYQHVIDNAHQTGECVVKPLSPHYAVTSDSDTVTDEGISDHELSTDRAPVERINDSTSIEIASASSSADRPTTAQNSTSINSATDVRSTLEQEMLDNFAILFTQMGSTLRYTTDMCNTLRSSILDIAQTYKKLLRAVEQFNSTQNSAGNESFSINLNPEVRQSPEERHIEVTASTSSSTQNQHSNDDANKPPKKKCNSWRFVLPPEYDPHDTKWTLKYRTNLPGLVELMPQSGVYVSYRDLKYCQHVSKDCKSLARRLLSAVFNRKALSVCLSITERAQASDNFGSNGRPELDDHAATVLLHFVLEHGLQRGWNTDIQPILNTLHSEIREIRFKYGVVVEC